jgi:hypothetical protein
MLKLFNELFGCPYRLFCGGWWGHWFSYQTWRDGLKHAYQRITQGYSFRDCWSVDYHITRIMPGMLDTLEKNSHLMWPTTKKGKRDFIQMREGFKAAKRLQDRGDGESDDKWSYHEKMGVTVEEWSAYEMRRFNNGMRVFTKRFFQLWD